MLWYKAWLDTRWRFLIGLVVAVLSAGGTVIAYPEVMKLVPLASGTDAGGGLVQRRVQEAIALTREYRGYVWLKLFRENLTQMATLFAVLLGSGGVLSKTSGEPAIFTLSLPATRRRLLGVRAGAGLAELFVLTLTSSLVIPLMSPAVGESYSVVSALVHGLCLFIASSVFFSLALLLSTVFTDLWRPLLIALAIAALASLCEQALLDQSPYGLFSVMSGERYFRNGVLPWIGLLVSIGLSAVMASGAARNIESHDF